MRVVLLFLTIILLVGCAPDYKKVTIVRTQDRKYIIDKSTLVHLENGCISFVGSCTCSMESNNDRITVCGTYSIEERN